MLTKRLPPSSTRLSYTTLVRSMAAPRTTMESDALSDPSLEVVTLAVLSNEKLAVVAQVVVVEMCPVSTEQEVKSPKEHDRKPEEMEQIPTPALTSIDQQELAEV